MIVYGLYDPSLSVSAKESAFEKALADGRITLGGCVVRLSKVGLSKYGHQWE